MKTLISTFIIAITILSVETAYAATDRFGITQLYPTSGNTYVSSWDNGTARTLSSGTRDGSTDLVARGDGSVRIDGKGIATLTGSAPRMYLYDSAKTKKWGDVEVTFYAQRISEVTALSYAGFMAGVKTNHTVDTNYCDDRGYFGRMLYDGRIDFEKEIMHHDDANGYVQFSTIRPWTSLPKNQWIGYKLVAYDVGNSVKLELYEDLTGGANGGTWKLMISAVDMGQYGSSATPCASGVNPALPLTGKNVSVYVRNDGLGTANYKWFSVREISANSVVPPTPTSTPPAPKTIDVVALKTLLLGIKTSLTLIIGLIDQAISMLN